MKPAGAAHLAGRPAADEVHLARQRQRGHRVRPQRGALRYTLLARLALLALAGLGHRTVEQHVAVAVVHRGVGVVQLERVRRGLPVLDGPLGGRGARLVHALGEAAAACMRSVR